MNQGLQLIVVVGAQIFQSKGALVPTNKTLEFPTNKTFELPTNLRQDVLANGRRSTNRSTHKGSGLVFYAEKASTDGIGVGNMYIVIYSN